MCEREPAWEVEKALVIQVAGEAVGLSVCAAGGVAHRRQSHGR